MQCASSMAKKETLTEVKNSIFSFLVNDSGATYSIFVLPAVISFRTCWSSDFDSEEFMKCAILSSSLTFRIAST